MLTNSIQYLKGVGPKKYNSLNLLGLHTLNDLIFYFPRSWEDRYALSSLMEIKFGEKNTIYGKIEEVHIQKLRNNIGIVEAVIFNNNFQINAKWFRKISRKYDSLFYLKQDLEKGRFIYIYGEEERGEIKVLDYEIEKENSINFNRIIPIYRASEKIDNKFLRNLIRQVLKDNTQYLVEFLPKKIIEKYGFLSFQDAINQIHFPDSFDEKNKAYFRLAFNEFFMLELVLMQEYKRIKRLEKSHQYLINKNILTPIKNSLSFDLTIDQKKVINEIFNDMTSKFPMNRLLQGDVGSGKTIVALFAMILATSNCYQAAIMAPTEVLAKQHLKTITELTAKFGVRIGFLSGSISAKEKKLLLDDLLNGKVDIIIGTHAVFSEDIKFSNLRLIVIDEQHKFGVKERLLLREKSGLIDPDILVMSATPIPRTLAMSIYGDLDVSTIKTMPKNRKSIATFIASQSRAIESLILEINNGRQGYIVYPAVEEDNKLELKSAEEMFKKLKGLYFKDIEIGLLHGKMKQKEKDAVMENFVNNKIKVLITTTVVEVGVNIPNASIMIIEHAERFGLSTLHQLRGRIGRGEYKSTCFLVPAKRSKTSSLRLSAMLSSNDGFFLAEKDLEIRGPGEFLGKNQHGFLEVSIGDLTLDSDIIDIAKKEASLFLDEVLEGKYSDQELGVLHSFISQKYGDKINFLNI